MLAEGNDGEEVVLSQISDAVLYGVTGVVHHLASHGATLVQNEDNPTPKVRVGAQVRRSEAQAKVAPGFKNRCWRGRKKKKKKAGATNLGGSLSSG